jgi:membrane associated rhomboid family serine protease
VAQRVEAALIPLGDRLKRRRFPFATLGLILAMTAAFVWMALLPRPEAVAVVARLALVPARLQPLLLGDPSALPALVTLVTSLFVHAGLLHLGGNLLFLWAFGKSVEEEMGPAGFLGFFLLCGLLAGLVHTLAHPASLVPTVGASGAISGVMGAYLGLHPKQHVRSLVLLVVWPLRLELPAGAWLLGWLLLQIVSGVRTLGGGDRAAQATGVAFWAHVGGFAAGLALFRFFVAAVGRRPRLQAARRS